MMAKLIGVGVLALLLVLAAYGLYRFGYNTCANEDKLAVQSQKLNDVKAVAEIKGTKKAKVKENERTKKSIKNIKDPSGCAKSVIPVERVNKLLDSFNSQ